MKNELIIGYLISPSFSDFLDVFTLITQILAPVSLRTKLQLYVQSGASPEISPLQRTNDGSSGFCGTGTMLTVAQGAPLT